MIHRRIRIGSHLGLARRRHRDSANGLRSYVSHGFLRTVQDCCCVHGALARVGVDLDSVFDRSGGLSLAVPTFTQP